MQLIDLNDQTIYVGKKKDENVKVEKLKKKKVV